MDPYETDLWTEVEKGSMRWIYFKLKTWNSCKAKQNNTNNKILQNIANKYLRLIYYDIWWAFSSLNDTDTRTRSLLMKAGSMKWDT